MCAASSQHQLIELHNAAPQKPATGDACNGCGVCCAAEPCSLAAIVLQQRDGACLALEWDDVDRRYRCGLVLAPQQYRRWLAPLAWPLRLVFRCWIAAGKGCDSDAVVVDNEDRRV